MAEEDKWPWSITSREYGRLEQEVQHIDHRVRNIRMVNDALDSRIDAVQAELKDLSKELEKVRTKIRAVFAAAVFVAGLAAWLIDTAISLMD